MSVVNKLHKCNGLLNLGSVITSWRVIKERDAPFEQRPKRDEEQWRPCGYLGREHSPKRDTDAWRLGWRGGRGQQEAFYFLCIGSHCGGKMNELIRYCKISLAAVRRKGGRE